MASIKVLGSSSKGNGYVIETSGEALFLEAGVAPKNYFDATTHKRRDVVGCLISHNHGDHAKYAESFSLRDINIYCNEDVANHRPIRPMKTRILPVNKWYEIENFSVYPFLCKHDVPNYGYIIKHPEFEPILFATDTYAYPSIFKGIKNFLIEANYSDELLEKSNIDIAQRNRLYESHMSLDYALKYLEECHAEDANTITLIHLSDRHSNEDEFQKRVIEKFCVPCYIADKGMEIDISKELI